jgi:hypothetical protein
VVQPFEDVAPSATEVTNYDREHILLYVCLLDRKQRGRDWRETVRAFFGIDFDHEPERARSVYDSHFARATWLAHTPEFTYTFQLAPYLWA